MPSFSKKKSRQGILPIAISPLFLIPRLFRNNCLNFAPYYKMLIEILKSKIHNAKVTQTELHYVGSITIDEDLMDAANLIEGEKVLVVNNNNGERLDTYVIKGKRGSKMICLNGAAARKAQVGDTVIIISFAQMDFEEAKTFKPNLAFVGPDNSLV